MPLIPAVREAEAGELFETGLGINSKTLFQNIISEGAGDVAW